MGLLLNLADEGKHRLIGINADLAAFRRYQRPGAVTVILYHAEYRHRAAKLLCDLPGGAGVGNAAVNEKHIRQRQELFVPVCCPLQTPPKHLLHGRIVIRPTLQFLDLEPPICRFQRLRTLIYHHGCHNVISAGIGNIVRLQTLRRRTQSCHPSQRQQRVVAALGSGGGALGFFPGIPPGHGQQFRLFAPLGNVYPDFVSCTACQRFTELRTVTGIRRQQDLTGQHGTGQIVLGSHCCQHLSFAFFVVCRKKLGFPPCQLAVFNMQHGTAALTGTAIDTPYIGIGADTGDHRLLVAKGADGIDPVTERRCLLKAQRLCFLRHFLRHLADQLLPLAFQQSRRLLHTAGIFLFGHFLAAETVTATHVIIQTRPLLADIPWEFPVAGRQLQRRTYRFQR